ncbi:MAG: DEAD/DEAH box helicase [Planctomycetaceae bacterium]|nr:DEAD/DEAH box helicase [Planctomycetaceae bacterium]
MPFKTLDLIQPLLLAVESEGYTIATEIQKEAIPYVLKGRDLLGCAQTGTGKTAAFALPILQRLHSHRPADSGGQRRPVRALVLTPTRELAAQIGESFRAYGKNLSLRHTVVFGGVKQGPQTTALHRGVDILVATPGRLLDLLNQRVLTLKGVEILVLDEADRMLDMGFIHDIRRVIAQIPAKRQTLMFSATMPREIRDLANTLLSDPVHVKVAAESPAADTVEQAIYFVETRTKIALLEHLLRDAAISRALVFTRTKHGADKVVRKLTRGEIAAEAIHSNKSQGARLRALANFKAGKTRVLVASDIAARGLDVDDISHVFNYDLPNVAETYVHRIGRTGRAGARGKAISFCSEEQRDDLVEIERLVGRRLPVLQHAIKAPPAEPRVGGDSHEQSAHVRRERPAVKESTPAAKGSPEQQRSAFWRSRQRRPSGASRRRRGR